MGRMHGYLKTGEGAKQGCLGSSHGSSPSPWESPLGDLPASGVDPAHAAHPAAEQGPARRKPAGLRVPQARGTRVESETFSPKPPRRVTDSLYRLLTPSIVGTFIDSDFLSDSRLGSDDWTRRKMKFCPRKGHSVVCTHTDVVGQPWVGKGLCSGPPSPPCPPAKCHSRVSQLQCGTVSTAQSLCTHGPFPWHA